MNETANSTTTADRRPRLERISTFGRAVAVVALAVSVLVIVATSGTALADERGGGAQPVGSCVQPDYNGDHAVDMADAAALESDYEDGTTSVECWDYNHDGEQDAEDVSVYPAFIRDYDGSPLDYNEDDHENVLDVQALFADAIANEYHDWPDVNADGHVNIVDVQALFAAITS